MKKRRWYHTRLGFAILGLALLVALGVMWFPSVGSHSPSPRRLCGSHLRQIGCACRMYAMDHSGAFPTNLWVLVPDYVGSGELFICPAAGKRPADVPQGEQRTDFVIVPHLITNHPGNVALAFCPPGNHGGAGGHILFVDGSVQWFELADFSNVLERGRTACGDPAGREPMFLCLERDLKSRYPSAKIESSYSPSGHGIMLQCWHNARVVFSGDIGRTEVDPNGFHLFVTVQLRDLTRAPGDVRHEAATAGPGDSRKTSFVILLSDSERELLAAVVYGPLVQTTELATIGACVRSAAKRHDAGWNRPGDDEP